MRRWLAPLRAWAWRRLRDPVLSVDVLQLVKTVAAAVLAWTLADRVLGLGQAFLAPWSALLVLHATVYRTVWHSAQQVAMTLLGVLLAFGAVSVFGAASVFAVAARHWRPSSPSAWLPDSPGGSGGGQHRRRDGGAGAAGRRFPGDSARRRPALPQRPLHDALILTLRNIIEGLESVAAARSANRAP